MCACVCVCSDSCVRDVCVHCSRRVRLTETGVGDDLVAVVTLLSLGGLDPPVPTHAQLLGDFLCGLEGMEGLEERGLSGDMYPHIDATHRGRITWLTGGPGQVSGGDKQRVG